jgi:hypothetical protein
MIVRSDDLELVHQSLRNAAAHSAGMAGMGRSESRRRGISNNPGLLAL